jgi:hypothetical protein
MFLLNKNAPGAVLLPSNWVGSQITESLLPQGESNSLLRMPVSLYSKGAVNVK